MPYIVRDLGTFVTPTSSGTATAVTAAIGHLDDATNITIFFTTSSLSTATGIQVSQFDPADPFPQIGVTQSSAWYSISTANVVLPPVGSSVMINNISFRGLRLQANAASSDNGDIIAYVTKQITV